MRRALRCGVLIVVGVISVHGSRLTDAMEVGTNHWVVEWQWPSADPFDDYRNVTGADPFRPEFLEETGLYKVHRFMNWNRTTDSTVVHWSERAQQSDAHQSPIAYEWMIDLCNRHSADIWITVPHRTVEDQNYWTELAELILELLDPELKVYVEYSNETWNGIFGQALYAREQGMALGLDVDEYRAGAEFHVYAAVRLFEHFEAVWGADNPRLVNVIAGQSVNTYLTSIHLEALSDATINPEGTSADVYAIAPYFGHEASSIEDLEGDVLGAIEDTRNQSKAIVGSGLNLVAYEGGQHVTTNAAEVNRNPRMYDLYITYLNGIDDYLDVFVHYAHAGAFSTRGAWGAIETIGQDPAEAHKYRAIRDYVAENPPDGQEDGGVDAGPDGGSDALKS